MNKYRKNRIAHFG